MHKIVSKVELAHKIKWFEVHAPDIAKKSRPGQFIMLIVGERNERTPLTIAGIDSKNGTISFAFNEVGKTTKELGFLKEGDSLENVLGPLGNPSEIKNFGRVLCVGGGVMIAPTYLQVQSFREAGNDVTTVIGARTKKLLFFEDKMKALSRKVYVATDDGSQGHQGLGFLKDLLQAEKFDRCVAIGPVVMMKRVCKITKPFGIPTTVTLTPIMVDGMGMCGCCRVSIDGQMKFACVDGPEFNGHLVDFEELINRQRMFLPEERLSSLLWEKSGDQGVG
jgi:ferredoxin--NADP+ reductase